MVGSLGLSPFSSNTGVFSSSTGALKAELLAAIFLMLPSVIHSVLDTLAHNCQGSDSFDTPSP